MGNSEHYFSFLTEFFLKQLLWRAMETGASGPPGQNVPEVVMKELARVIDFVTIPFRLMVAKTVKESEFKKKNAILKNAPVSLKHNFRYFSNLLLSY